MPRYYFAVQSSNQAHWRSVALRCKTLLAPSKLRGAFRAIVFEQPNFVPAWRKRSAMKQMLKATF
jgi:hypothetical protein